MFSLLQPQNKTNHTRHPDLHRCHNHNNNNNNNSPTTTTTTTTTAKRTFAPFRPTITFATILMVSSLILNGGASASSASSSSSAHSASPQPSTATDRNPPDPIKIIFSDLDGTLIHYPPKPSETDGAPTPTPASAERPQPQQGVLKFPPSSTGLCGEISTKTISLVDEIRHNHGVKFVLISGMRTSTLLQRLPYLPRADAYCSENGGRIFYPIDKDSDTDGDTDGDEDDVFWVTPKRYKHDGNDKRLPRRTRRFGIREDKSWRAAMKSSLCGNSNSNDSYGPFSLQDIYEAQDDPAATSVPLHERDGFLWDFARDLVHTHGFVVDTKGYATCFRVNQKQQTLETAAQIPPSDIQALLDNPRWKHDPQRPAVAASVNLKCVDFYPSRSGKKNCCLYLASKFFSDERRPRQDARTATRAFPSPTTTHVESADEHFLLPTVDDDEEEEDDAEFDGTNFLSKYAVCLCDDDNDLEMALACQHAYLPDVSSESMKETVARCPDHFTTTFARGAASDTATADDGDGESIPLFDVVEGTDASDRALALIWDRTGQNAPPRDVKPSPLSSMVRPKVLALALLGAVLVLK